MAGGDAGLRLSAVTHSDGFLRDRIRTPAPPRTAGKASSSARLSLMVGGAWLREGPRIKERMA